MYMLLYQITNYYNCSIYLMISQLVSNYVTCFCRFLHEQKMFTSNLQYKIQVLLALVFLTIYLSAILIQFLILPTQKSTLHNTTSNPIQSQIPQYPVYAEQINPNSTSTATKTYGDYISNQTKKKKRHQQLQISAKSTTMLALS